MDAPREHDDRVDLRRRGEAQEEHCVKRGGCFRGFPAGAPEASGAVGAGARGGFGDAEVRGEESAAELVGQAGMAAREGFGNGFAAGEGFAGDDVDIGRGREERGRGGGWGARADGRSEEAARILLTVLRGRDIAVPDAARERILAERDPARIERWIEKAIVVATLTDVLDEPS